MQPNPTVNHLWPVCGYIVSGVDVFGGVPRIEERRIGVHHKATRVNDESENFEQVAAAFGIDLADFNRVLACYYRPDEMLIVESQRCAMPDGLRTIPAPEDFDGSEGPEPEA